MRRRAASQIFLAAAIALSGCRTVEQDAHLEPTWALKDYEAFSINGIHQNQLGPAGAELVDSIRGTARGQKALSGNPDLIVEVFKVGEENGDRYGIWVEEAVAAALPVEWSGKRTTLPVYLLDPRGLAVVKSRAKTIEQIGLKNRQAE
jgi:hypothetical protein